MRIFESQEEYNAYELEKLLDLINNQRTIYALNFNEDTRELNYRIIYGLNDISERTIKLTDKDYDDQKILFEDFKLIFEVPYIMEEIKYETNSMFEDIFQ